MTAALQTDRLAPGVGTPPRPGADSIAVMVIDDSLTVRTVFSRMIDREADLSIVAQASTAEEALGILRSMRVDVILLDLEMPGMGGLEALPQILETGGGQVLVVSSLTADGAEAIAISVASFARAAAALRHLRATTCSRRSRAAASARRSSCASCSASAAARSGTASSGCTSTARPSCARLTRW